MPQFRTNCQSRRRRNNTRTLGYPPFIDKSVDRAHKTAMDAACLKTTLSLQTAIVLETKLMPIMDQEPAESEAMPAAITFDSFGLSRELLVTLSEQELITPTPIQAISIPLLLEGRDLIGLAQTGTGKTAAFLLPILTMLGQSPAVRPGQPPSALILAPTRELANQIRENLQNLARNLNMRHIAVFGGARYDTQIRGLRRGVDIVVATPGRLEDLMERGAFDPSGITHFVLDEADHMLDLGFYPAIQRIAASLPKPRQTMLFSATMPPEIEKLASRLLIDPAYVKAPQNGVTADKVKQHVTMLSEGEKRDRLCEILSGPDIDQVLIFVRTRRRADALAKFMQVRGFSIDALHGDMRQSIRQKVLQNFRSGSLRAIIATDVAARGIDIAALGHVINFDLTDTSEAYIHRIGRTGRAGLAGIAISFCAPDEQHKLAAIISHVGAKVELFNPDGSPISEFVAARTPSSRPRRRSTQSARRSNQNTNRDFQRRPIRKHNDNEQRARTDDDVSGFSEHGSNARNIGPKRPRRFANDKRTSTRTSDWDNDSPRDKRSGSKARLSKPTSPRSSGKDPFGQKSDRQKPAKRRDASPKRPGGKAPFSKAPVFNSRPNFGDKQSVAKPDQPRRVSQSSNSAKNNGPRNGVSKTAGLKNAGPRKLGQKSTNRPGQAKSSAGRPTSPKPQRDGGHGRLRRRR
jgi:ATP-dependent RNA helicase RhlE